MMKEKISHSYLAQKQWDKDDRWIPLEWSLITDSTKALLYKMPQTPKSLVERYVNYTLDHVHYFTHRHLTKTRSQKSISMA